MKFWGQGMEAGKDLDTRGSQRLTSSEVRRSQREDPSQPFGKESVQAEDMAEPREKMGEKGHEGKERRGIRSLCTMCSPRKVKLHSV